MTLRYPSLDWTEIPDQVYKLFRDHVTKRYKFLQTSSTQIRNQNIESSNVLCFCSYKLCHILCLFEVLESWVFCFVFCQINDFFMINCLVKVMVLMEIWKLTVMIYLWYQTIDWFNILPWLQVTTKINMNNSI